MKYKQGLVKTVVIIVIALIVLGYFGFNLRNIINSPVVQDNLRYAGEITVNVWNNYLKSPSEWAFNQILKAIGKGEVQSLMEATTSTTTPK